MVVYSEKWHILWQLSQTKFISFARVEICYEAQILKLNTQANTCTPFLTKTPHLNVDSWLSFDDV